MLSLHFILVFGQQDLVEHHAFSLHGHGLIFFTVCVDQVRSHQKRSGLFHVNIGSWNHTLLIAFAEITQVQKPFVSSLTATDLVIFVQLAYGIFRWIPILIEQTDKQFLHGHLTDSVYVQIRKHAGNVIQQNLITANDVKVLRPKIVFIIIQNIGDPVHGHCGFA